MKHRHIKKVPNKGSGKTPEPFTYMITEKPGDSCTIQNLIEEWDGIRNSGPELDWGDPMGTEVW